MITGATPAKLPSTGLILPYFLLSSISLFILTILLFFSSNSFGLHYFHPRLLALTHIATIGFISSIIFGSLFQMLPVLFDVKVYSERLGKLCFFCLTPGIILLTISFWNFNMGLLSQIGGSLILISFLLFAVNFYLSVRPVKSWYIEAELISTSIIWLVITGIVGLLLVFNFTNVFIPKSHLEVLKIHAHMGLVGWIFLLTQGVSSRLIPMFFVSEKPSRKPLQYSYYLSNSGLLIFAVSVYLGASFYIQYTAVLIMITSVGFFLYYVYKAYLNRTRRKTDVGLKLTLLSFIVLIITILLGLIIPFDLLSPVNIMILRIIYGILAILGFAGILILGQGLKIIPFILWIHKFQKYAGKKKIPLHKELVSEKLSQLMMYLFIFGLAGFLIGAGIKQPIIIRLASTLLILSSLLFNINILKALFYKQKTENE